MPCFNQVGELLGSGSQICHSHVEHTLRTVEQLFQIGSQAGQLL